LAKRFNPISVINYVAGGLFFIFFMMSVAWASENDAVSSPMTSGPSLQDLKKSEKNSYVITADLLTVDRDHHVAEFKGDVKVVQGDMEITAHRIQLIFREDQVKENQLKVDEASISKIIAYDAVRIKLDNAIALAHQAVYNTDEKVLVLSGEHSQIIMDENTLSGNRITFYREEGRLTVEGEDSERVNAVFHSGEKETK
jgi:lipopolysaccharide export system protein LptA